MEIGDKGRTKNLLEQVLLLNSNEHWAYVVLANLWIKNEKDPLKGEQYLNMALAIQPEDPWALNSLATLRIQQGHTDEAIRVFRKAIQANPEVANPYLGLAITYNNLGNYDQAIKTLQELFGRAQEQDVRSKPIFESARALWIECHHQLSRRSQDAAMKAVDAYRTALESLSGIPIKVSYVELDEAANAIIQMAWKYNRDHHLIRCRPSYPKEFIVHLMAHELSHLELECKARQAQANRFFATSSSTREASIRSLARDIRCLEKSGYPLEAIDEVIVKLVQGLCSFLFNCPIDMLIETALRKKMPEIASSQFLSLLQMSRDAMNASISPEIQKLTPTKIFEASLALNGANALFIDDLYLNATAISQKYASHDAFALSKKLFQHWKSRYSFLEPGQEYELVDDFADILGLRDWYLWQKDPGNQEIGKLDEHSRANNELLQQRESEAIGYFVDALGRFNRLAQDKIREISFEIALLGNRGLDFVSNERKYSLAALPGEKFNGLELMCLMYAGFRRVAPDQDVGMPLEEPFMKALSMFNARSGAGKEVPS